MNKNRGEMRKAFKAAFPYTIPVFTGFVVLGMTYGILMQAKGYGPIWSFLMSLIAYCGSMQFAAIPLLVAFNPMQAMLLSLMVNARHLFYGISMLDKYKGLGKVKAFLIYTLCDETFSIVSSVEIPKEINKKYFYFWISFLDYSYWGIAALLGGIAGQFIHFNLEGLDFVLTALFVVLFLEQWKERKNRKAAVIGIVGAVVSLCIFGSNRFVIFAMLMILLGLIAGKKQLMKKEGESCN